MGNRDYKGYGRFAIDCVGRMAHRVSYQLHRGDIPDGMLVCHSCDNTGCVNPDHLFIGTNADNMADMVAKGRQNKCKGVRNGRSKLLESTVLAIRHADGMTNRQVAERLGVTVSQVADIRSGRTWKHLEARNG